MISQCAGNLIPARFLILLAHLTICIVTLSSPSGNIYACLPEEYEEEDYHSKDFQCTIERTMMLTDTIAKDGGATESSTHKAAMVGRADSIFQVGLYLSLALIALEFLGFLSGTSMFLPSVATFSVGCHASACVLMAQSLLDNWSCHVYWWIFGFCSVIPAALEMAVALNVHVLKRI